jgi:hypothetical protein
MVVFYQCVIFNFAILVLSVFSLLRSVYLCTALSKDGLCLSLLVFVLLEFDVIKVNQQMRNYIVIL